MHNVDINERSDKSNDPIQSATIATRCEGYGATITGLTIVSNDTLAFVCGLTNYSVRLLDIDTGKILSRSERLREKPFDITAISDNKLAVTVPALKWIRLLSSTDGKLILSHRINTDGCCKGISYGDGKLVVTFVDPPKVEVLDMSGEKLYTSLGGVMFRAPRYVSVSSDEESCYVSDKQMIIHMDWEGQVIRRYTDQSMDAKGITSTKSGFLVCDGRGNVCKMSATCHKDIVYSMNLPASQSHVICVNSTDNSFFVSFGNKESRLGLIKNVHI